MTEPFRKFVRLNLFVLIVLGVGQILVFSLILPDLFHYAFPVVLVMSFIVNLLVFQLFTRKEVPAGRALAQVGLVFMTKFFYYLLVAILFLFLIRGKNIRITFVIVLFIIYFAYTMVEVRALSGHVKSTENND